MEMKTKTYYSNQTILLKDIIKYSNKKGSSEALLFMVFRIVCGKEEQGSRSATKLCSENSQSSAL